MTRAVALLFVGLVIGVAIGGLLVYVYVGDSPAPRPAAAPARPAAPATLERPDSPASPAQPVPVARSSEDVLETVRDLLDRLPEASAPAGSGFLTGRVRDPKGQPVADVTIRVQPHRASTWTPPRSGAGAPRRTSLEDAVRAAVESHRRADSETQETVTDAAGAYRITGLPEGFYNVRAYLEGHEIKGAGGLTDRVRTGSSIDFVATTLLAVPISVLLPDDSPAQRATIEVRKATSKATDRPDFPGEAWSAEQPVIYLRPGRFVLRATLTGLPGDPSSEEEMASEPESVRIAAGVDAEPLTFYLRTRTGVKGRILFPAGEEYDHVNVLLTQAPAGQAPNFSRVSYSSAERTWVRKEDPRFAFLDLAAGSYAVGVSRTNDQSVVSYVVVDVRDRMVEQDIEIPALDLSECLIVWAYGKDGEILPQLSFSMRMQQRNGASRSNSPRTVRRSDGSICLLPQEDMVAALKPAAELGSRVFLSVTSDEYGSKEVELEPGEREVTIRFVDTATLKVTVAGYQGSGLEGSLSCELRSSPSTDDTRFYWGGQSGTRVGVDGTVTLGPAEVGQYQLVLFASSRRNVQWAENVAASVTPVSLQAGENALTISIPPLHSISVHVPEGKPGNSVQLQNSGKGLARVFLHRQLDENRKVLFENLSAGEYRLTHHGGGMPEMMRIRLPGPPEITFEGEPQNALLVTITDPKGALASAGLRDGDLVIAVDGKEFSNSIELMGALAAVVTKSETTFRVLRGRSQLDVSVSPKVLMDHSALGGEIQPTAR